MQDDVVSLDTFDFNFPIKYELVEAPDNFWAIKLSEGKYNDVVYRDGTIKFDGEDAEGNGLFSFEYDVLDHPAHFKREELVGEELNAHMGIILHGLLMESISKGTIDGNDREEHSEESDSQRRLHAEGDSVSKG